MATKFLTRIGSPIAWATAGPISVDIPATKYTITRLLMIQHLQFTISGGAFYNDWADRIISNLTLSGPGVTYFDFRNMRDAYWLAHFQGAAPVRPLPPATTVLMQLVHQFHFGVRPQWINPQTGMLEDNPWDLTAGIPPLGAGSLSLQGAFATATNGVGSATTTTTAGSIDLMAYGVRPDDGDAPAAYQPQAIPAWGQAIITPTATSSAFQTETNLAAGGYLRAIMTRTARVATTLPRDNSVLNSIRIWNQAKNAELITYGGQSSAAADHQVAELLSQYEAKTVLGQPAGDDVMIGTVATPSLNAAFDAGLVWFPLYKHTKPGTNHPLFGIDMRKVNAGDLRLQYGVANATAIEMALTYQRYQLNPDHPDSARY